MVNADCAIAPIDKTAKNAAVINFFIFFF